MGSRYARGGGARRGRRTVVSHMRAHVSGLCACEDYGRLVKEKVRGAGTHFHWAPPEGSEEFDRLAMREDVR